MDQGNRCHDSKQVVKSLYETLKRVRNQNHAPEINIRKHRNELLQSIHRSQGTHRSQSALWSPRACWMQEARRYQRPLVATKVGKPA